MSYIHLDEYVALMCLWACRAQSAACLQRFGNLRKDTSLECWSMYPTYSDAFCYLFHNWSRIVQKQRTTCCKHDLFPRPVPKWSTRHSQLLNTDSTIVKTINCPTLIQIWSTIKHASSHSEMTHQWLKHNPQIIKPCSESLHTNVKSHQTYQLSSWPRQQVMTHCSETSTTLFNTIDVWWTIA